MLKSLCLFGECKEDINLRIIYMRLEFPSSRVKRIKIAHLVKKIFRCFYFCSTLKVKSKFLISLLEYRKINELMIVSQIYMQATKQTIIEKQREREIEWGGYKIKCAASSDFKDELISIVRVKIIHKFFLLLSTKMIVLTISLSFTFTISKD